MGTTTLKSTGGDFTSIATWESTQQGTLTEPEILECYIGTTVNGGWQADGSLDQSLVIDGWVTNGTNFVTVKAAEGEGHRGVPGAGFLMKTSADGFVIYTNQPYTVIDELEVYNTINTGTAAGGIALANSFSTAKNCIATTTRTQDYAGAFKLLATSTQSGHTAINCLALRVGDQYRNEAGFSVFSGYPATLINCTAISFVNGFFGSSADSDYTLTNCVAIAGTTAFFNLSASTMTYCASDDTTAIGTGSITGITSAVFKDYASGHYQPADGGLLHGAGTDLSLGTDIRGETITDISIGAYDNDVLLRTLKSTLGDYSLMSVWESTEQQDLTASGNRAVLECYTGTYNESSRFDILGWTADATNNITIKAAAGNEHGGVIGAGAIVVVTSTTIWHFIISVPYTVVSEITVDCASVRNSRRNIETAEPGTNCLLDSLILPGQTTDIEGKQVNLATVNNTVRNCNLYNINYYGVDCNAVGNTVENCTLTDNAAKTGWAVRSSVDILLKNNVAYDLWDTVNYTPNQLAGSTSNASQDLTGQVTGITSAVFKDYASGHYQPAENGLLHGAGTDLSLGTDIRGETITDISIGAYDNDLLVRSLKSTLGDYSLMSVWESTEQQDLTASGNRAVLECDAFTCTETAQVDINGWTTGAANYITIKPAAGAEHNGVYGAGFILTNTASGAIPVIDVEIPYIEFHGFTVVSNVNTSRCVSKVDVTVQVGNVFDSMIMRTLRLSTGEAFYTQNQAQTIIRNCLILCDGNHSTASCLWVRYDTSDHLLENSTLVLTHPSAAGVVINSANSSSTVIAKNTVCLGAPAERDFFGTYHVDSTNNASGDATAPGTSPVTGVVLTDGVDFVSPSTGDYTPTSTGKLAGAGTDLSADFDDDITGTPR